MPPPTPLSLAGRAPAILRHGRRVPGALQARTFTARALTAYPRAQSQLQASKLVSKRPFSVSAFRLDASVAEQAPNPKAYLESGVVKPRESVDVKKVLVIGSGGLAIGQAGEFDYSGTLSGDRRRSKSNSLNLP